MFYCKTWYRGNTKMHVISRDTVNQGPVNREIIVQLSCTTFYVQLWWSSLLQWKHELIHGQSCPFLDFLPLICILARVFTLYGLCRPYIGRANERIVEAYLRRFHGLHAGITWPTYGLVICIWKIPSLYLYFYIIQPLYMTNDHYTTIIRPIITA